MGYMPYERYKQNSYGEWSKERSKSFGSLKEGKVPGSQNERQPLLQRKTSGKEIEADSIVHIWGTRKGWVG